MKRFLGIVLLCAALLTGCAQAAERTEVLVLKIGKADAILIMAGEHTVLIDAGEKEDGEAILKKLAKRNIDSLDALIITHFDKDHVGGADTVLQGIQVQALYDADYESGSNTYEEYQMAVQAMGVPRYRVSKEIVLQLGSLVITLMPTALSAEGAKVIDNDQSLAVSISDTWHTFFITGDAEEARIDELLSNNIGPHDVIKMPHHGQNKANLAALLDATRPQIALITDSDKNPAEDAVLTLLEERGIQTYQTRNGDIRIVSDAKGITVVQ